MKDEDVDAVARALFGAHDVVTRVGEPQHDFDARTALEIEGWRAVARAALKLGARSPQVDRRARLAELMAPDSTNFLGTGLSLREFVELHSVEQVSRSWSLQPREEKRRRLGAVMRLSVELDRIRQVGLYATRMAEMSIEAVIEGDWKMVEEWAEHFTFADEPGMQGSSSHRELYATFCELLLQALRADKEVSA